jgi:hypothetical protein
MILEIETIASVGSKETLGMYQSPSTSFSTISAFPGKET